MKKSLLFLFLLFSITYTNAQSYLGYYHDNYAGVHGVLYNPASIVDSRFKTDINLFSFSTSISNDLYAVEFSEALKSGYDFDSQAKKSFSDSNNAVVNLDLMGPAFMFNITPNQSLAVFSRARSFVNVVDINGNLVNELSKEEDQADFNYFVGNPNFTANSWGEFGLSYAVILYRKGTHFLKGGATIKYLQGIANNHFKGENVTLKYVENKTNPELSEFISTGTAIYGTSQDFEENSTINIDANSRGLGFDLGLVYEWRPDFDTTKKDVANFKDMNKYKLRFSFSLTDLGSIDYKKGIRKNYNINNTINQEDFDNAGSFDLVLSDFYTETAVSETVKSNLPTAFHTDVDWNIHKKLYLNINGDFSLTDSGALNQISIENRLSVTPRFESRGFSLYVPVSFMQYSGTRMGLGLRTGLFFIGSGSALSSLLAKESKGTDVQFGVKIPVFQKKIKSN